MKLKTLSKLFVIVAWAVAVGIWLSGRPGTVDAQGPTDEISAQAALGTVFTFQGHLTDANLPANGTYDFEFKLYDAAGSGNPPTGGTQVGGTVTPDEVKVTNGSFAVELDFGDVFKGEARWLQIGVRRGADTGSYRPLSPRVRLTLTPYALSLRPGASIVGSATKGLSVEIPTGSGGAAGLYGKCGSGSSFSAGTAAGVWGDSSCGPGVFGSSTFEAGIVGFSGSGYGAFGSSNTNHGLVGESGGFDTSGVLGASTNSDGFGGGFHNHSNGVALYAEGNGSGRDRATLRMLNTQTNGGIAAYVTNNSDQATAHFANSGTTGQVLYLQSNGGNFIEARNNDESAIRFAVDYAGKTTTRVLQITGGADLSEQFDIRSSQADLKPSPGLVVSIDPEHPGELVVSDRAYDRTVAGVISGAGGVNTGMVLSQPGSAADGQYPVALTGRVYVWADASSGPIQPGDLLTTSDTPGHAMKVTDYEQAHGAILGKAMSGLEEGKGLVLLLVSLQ